MFWPPQNEVEEHLYEIRNGQTKQYVLEHVAALAALQGQSQPAAEGWIAVSEWLTVRVEEGMGAIELGITENGDIGLWRNDSDMAWGTGDTVEEAIEDAMHRYTNGKAYGATPPAPEAQKEGKSK